MACGLAGRHAALVRAAVQDIVLVPTIDGVALGRVGLVKRCHTLDVRVCNFCQERAIPGEVSVVDKGSLRQTKKKGRSGTVVALATIRRLFSCNNWQKRLLLVVINTAENAAADF